MMEVVDVEITRKLPDAEFEIMRVVWANEPPITTKIIMEQLGNERKWKPPNAITLMLRLVERGFLRTEKNGKERTYFPVVAKEDYLKFETEDFIKRFHDDSILKLVDTAYDGKNMSDQEIDDLLSWAKSRRK
jgi:predicted transcriptional regulator